MKDIRCMLEALSSLSRTGWMLRGVPHELAENVAEHSFWSAVLAFEISIELNRHGFKIDPYKTAVIALLHDTAESIIGDISKTANIEVAKTKAEYNAIESLPISYQSKRLLREFIEGDSKESIIARVSEILATILKSEYYLSVGYSKVVEIRDNLKNQLNKIIDSLGWGITLMQVLERVTGLKLGNNMQ